MDVHVFRESGSLGDFVATRVIEAIERNPKAVIGLATGSSPLSSYVAWARIAAERAVALDRVRGFALDEYGGLDPEHPESYRSVIGRTVTEQVGLDPANVHVPAGTGDVEGQAAGYEAAIVAAGGIDVQLLGLGRNGHLGFNEPGSPFDSRTRLVNLKAVTIADNARYFGRISDVPTQAVTQGLGTIRDARELIVIVLGAAKAQAVAASIEGPLVLDMPGSVLRLHPKVLWCLDEPAASQLSETSTIAH